MKELERENAELKKIVADQALDIRMLTEVNAKNWYSPPVVAPPWIIFRKAIR